MFSVFERPPRRPGPELPHGEIMIEAPPMLPEPNNSASQALMYLPMALGTGAMALMWTSAASGPSTYLISGLYGMSMMGMMGGSLGRGSGDRRRKLDTERTVYMRYLAQTRRQVRRTAHEQRAALIWANPDPDALWSVALSSRLWERRAADRDFGSVRVAVGSQQLATPLIAPETRPAEDLEPLTAGALRRFLKAHSTAQMLPMAVSLRAFSRVVIGGDREAARGLVRAMLAHLVTFHAPDDLQIMVCASSERRADWEWTKWLPHAVHPSRNDGAGPIRLCSDELAWLEEVVGTDLDSRPRFSVDAAPLTDRPHLVVVFDGGSTPTDSRLLADAVQGLTVVDLVGDPGRHAAADVLRLQVADDRVEMLTRDPADEDAVLPLGRRDHLTTEQADALARQLAPMQLSGPDRQQALAGTVSLSSLLGSGDPADLDPTTSWRPRASRDQLRVPFGVGLDGSPVELDFKESALGGMGPHGMIIGATGSGKSELLRTLVLGLSMTHSSQTLNFVLVDFKGGATFLGLDRLPHVSAVITNLSQELILVDRMHDALHGEAVRRQELLRQAGNFVSARDYERARQRGAALAPLPSLLIVVDEFTELLASNPEFADLFVMIGRLGRSLGMHLLLASQHLDEGRLRGLGTHLSYRIGLRTFSAMESRVALGVPDAHNLPSVPGNGFLLHDNSNLVRFKAAHVSGAYRPRRAVSRPPIGDRILPYTTAFLDLPASVDEPEPTLDDQLESSSSQTILDVVVSRLADRGPAAHQVWLPPLGDPPTLDQLVLVPSEPDQLMTNEQRPQLQVPIGIIDKPFEQRRDLLLIDLSGAAGHIAIVGAPQSGKSTLLRTLVASVSLASSPDEAQFYGLDFGGGTLLSLVGLPHVGSIATRREPELVRRTVAEVARLLEWREQQFAEANTNAMTDYRRLRRSGQTESDGYAPDVFLLVDGWLALQQDFAGLDETIVKLASRGLGYGIHIVLTANRWAEIRPAIRDVLATRLELRLGEPFESEFNRRAAANVPSHEPGRGIVKDGLHFQGALPCIDGVAATHDLGAGLERLIAYLCQRWPDMQAPPIRLLPLRLAASALPTLNGAGVPIGIDEDGLAPTYIDFDTDPHFLVLGETGSGKSNLLRLIINGLTQRHRPEAARIIIADYRRNMLDAVDTDHLIGFAASREALTSLVSDVVDALTVRLPKPNLTPDELRTRSWWTGADLYFVVDDYDLVATQPANPLEPLLDLLPQGRDIGLHFVASRASGGAARALYEPLLRRINEIGTPTLLLSANPDEGPILGKIVSRRLPPGRGTLVSRRLGVRTVHTALAGSDETRPQAP
jgi:DNA segregation ATPase FtsK/SpoIIIE, S-DNA-T family